MNLERAWSRITRLVVAVMISMQLAVSGADRPSVGIALEGGGALGLAHIGVLRWLEEHRIPIDYIAGTSMGGLVGGVYATGLNPEELSKLVSTIDWDAVLRGQVSYRDLAYRRKEDRRAYQNSLEFGLKRGLTLPGGLNAGQEITFLFDRTALPYSNLKSFDDLPIPFRCIAADLSTGKQHIFKDGPLGEALRSTMSLPALFTPVSDGKTLYADGGLLNNLPVDVVKDMGAGIAIGVHLDASAEAETSPSMFSVLGRSISVMIAANELRGIQMADVLITVDLHGFTAMDYVFGEKLMARGYEAAEKKAGVLSRFALSEQDWAAYRQKKESRRLQPIKTIEKVQLAGVAESMSSEVQEVLEKSVAGEFSPDKIELELGHLRGIGRFSRFSYGLAPGSTTTLLVRGEQYNHAPPFVQVGVNVDGTDYNNVQFSFASRLTLMDLGGFRSELRTDVSLGSVWGLRSEYFRPFNPASKWFVAPNISLSDTPLNLYNRDSRVAEYRYGQYGGGVDVGYQFGRSAEFRAGYELAHINTRLQVGDPVLPEPNGRIGSTSIRYDLDARDNPVVPRQGSALRGRGQWVDAMPGATNGFPAAELQMMHFHKVSTLGSAFIRAAGGTTFGESSTGLPQFLLGGPGRLSAYGLNELRGNDYFLGALGYLHQVAQLPPLVGDKVYLVGTYEVGKTWGPQFPYKIATDGAVAVVAQTFLGPLAVGGSVGNMGHRKWYFQIGRIF